MQGTNVNIKGESNLKKNMDHTFVNDPKEGVAFYSLYL